MASKRGWDKRLAALEQLIQPPPDPGVDEFAPEQLVKRLKPGKPGGRTIADVWAERGFSEAERERASEWMLVCLRLDAEREAEHRRLNTPGFTPDPDEEAAYSQRIAGYQEAAHDGASWLSCREQHGPGLCVDGCPGKFWHPGQCSADCQCVLRHLTARGRAEFGIPEPSRPVDVQAGQPRVDVVVDEEQRAIWRAMDDPVPWGSAPAEVRKPRRGR
jgi:hypothetical protein